MNASRSIEPDRRRRLVLLVLLGGGLLAAALLPYYIGSPFWVLVATDICIFAVLGLSYNLLIGQVGLFSLGHAVFFGASSYAVANLVTNGTPLPIAIVGGVVASTLMALVIAVGTVHVSGIYFGIVTLAIAQAFYTGAGQNLFGLTGGENGLYIQGIPEFLNVNVNVSGLYWVALSVLVAVVFAVGILRRSTPGRIWVAIRENSVRAESLGINLRVQRVLVFTIAGGIAGLAGALNAILLQIASPDQLGITIVVQSLLIVIIGGPGSYLGPLLGAVVVRLSGPLLDELAQQDWVQALPNTAEHIVTSHDLVLGVLYIGLVLFLPGGFASILAKRGQRRQAERPQEPGDEQPVSPVGVLR